jgi:hypothetical protein
MVILLLHDLEDNPLITAFNSNEDFKVFSTQIIRGIKDTIIERENRTEILQDPDVIAELQQLHEKSKAFSGDKTAFEMYEIVSRHAENMGYTPIITERLLKNDGDSHNGYRVNLYDGKP